MKSSDAGSSSLEQRGWESTRPPPAKDLLPSVARGESGAVRACLQRYGPPIRALASRMLGSSAHDVDDAVQEALLAVWRSAARFDPTAGSEVTFIMTVARRRILDVLRARRRRPVTAELVEGQVQARDGASDERGELAEMASLARSALTQLRAEERQVLELLLLSGLSQSEAADAMSLPLGTVKTHARRGLIRLRGILGLGKGVSA